MTSCSHDLSMPCSELSVSCSLDSQSSKQDNKARKTHEPQHPCCGWSVARRLSHEITGIRTWKRLYGIGGRLDCSRYIGKLPTWDSGEKVRIVCDLLVKGSPGTRRGYCGDRKNPARGLICIWGSVNADGRLFTFKTTLDLNSKCSEGIIKILSAASRSCRIVL